MTPMIGCCGIMTHFGAVISGRRPAATVIKGPEADLILLTQSTNINFTIISH
ncbi:hypothetical protein JOB18_026944 [Solea senegalensis]|uniref:Uncharacterized protein n=1 Tax=Solea senegalensis TaxID=28829 RepID=A0AAV6RWV8_SOLSE|nr:hypothetical protein JOB18_026944 [Solea senegalensis]